MKDLKWEWILEAKERVRRETFLQPRGSGGELSAALAYPNTYRTAMSSLGFQAVYGLLEENGVYCERTFYPDEKYAAYFRSEKNLRTLETQKPLHDFHLLAFSVSYELDYPNLAAMLKMTDIPLFSSQRRQSDPLVMAGGAVTYLNPEPIADFIDFFVMGRGERTLPGVIGTLKNLRGLPREEILKELSRLDNIYVPSVHGADGKKDGSGCRITGRGRESGRFLQSSVLSADTEFSNTVLTEIMKGCPFSCGFCAVGNCFGRLRYRPAEEIAALLETFPRCADKIGLIGTCINTHPQFGKILSQIRGKNLQIGFSSLRAEHFTEETADFLSREGGGTITLAPECASESLRYAIGKKMSDKSFYDSIARAAASGIGHVRLYFMIGLPGETGEDIGEIGRMVKTVKKCAGKSPLRLTVSVNPFVPKAFTALQRSAQDTFESLTEKMKRIREAVAPGAKLKEEPPGSSVIQGILSRADRRISAAMSAGADGLSLKKWLRRLEKENLDAGRWLREIPETETLCWEHLAPIKRRETETV